MILIALLSPNVVVCQNSGKIKFSNNDESVDIVDVEEFDELYIGYDGIVVTVGDNYLDLLNISDWTDIGRK